MVGGEADQKGALKSSGRCADQPGQTANVDLCFVPARHLSQEQLPAVSGSSGHLVVHSVSRKEPGCWPGQLLTEGGEAYDVAMRAYAAATSQRLEHRKGVPTRKRGALTPWRRQWNGRAERYVVRQQREQEDAAWREAKAAQRREREAHQRLSRAEQRRQQAEWQAAQQAWQQMRLQRQELLQRRQEENAAWHARNRQWRKEGGPAPCQQVWLAVLVINDNCTRQSWGLPLFEAGSRVSGEEVVAALRALLPTGLQFLISDQGKHFRNIHLARLAQEREFVHVPIYRHRPQSNGMAERFVRTLKDWLLSRSWQNAEELRRLLEQFPSEYNHRPHQGLPIPGLSPNEFANRIWLM